MVDVEDVLVVEVVVVVGAEVVVVEVVDVVLDVVVVGMQLGQIEDGVHGSAGVQG